MELQYIQWSYRFFPDSLAPPLRQALSDVLDERVESKLSANEKAELDRLVAPAMPRDWSDDANTQREIGAPWTESCRDYVLYCRA